MSDFNYCRTCGKVTGITPELRCAACGMLICLVCVCTETRACVGTDGTPCGWARRGVCTACAGDVNALGNRVGDQISEMIVENQANIYTNH